MTTTSGIHAPEYVTPREAVETALQLHREGRLAEARLLYQRVLDVDPNNAEALHFLGLLRHQLGARPEGIAYLRRAVTSAPEYAAARSNLGNMLLEQGDLNEAEQAYRAALKCDPDLLEAKNNLGLVLQRRGQREAAEAVYRQVIAQAPESPLAYCNLGHLLFELGRIDEAASLLAEAVRIDPELAEAFHNLGHVESARHRPERAVEAYRRAVELGADAYLGLATALREQGLIDEAIAAYRRVIRIGARPATALYNLGMLLSATGRNAEAAEVYLQWLQDDPANPVASHMLAACQGEAVPPRASDAYVKAIFDGFAPRFDQRLDELEYRAPALVAEEVQRHLCRQGASLRILDAGCGTGLCGPLLRPFASHLTGVDLSGPMLERAAARGSYDDLIQAELTAYLAASPQCFDLIVSADTLVYFGDLEPVIAAAAQVLVPGGCLVATLERSNTESVDGYELGGHGRYSHSESYVRRVISAGGLQLVAARSAVLRQEMARPVTGLLFSAVRASEAPLS